MRDLHEPNERFAEKLEWQIGREVRRRNSAAQAPGWITWSRRKVAGAVTALILVSMAIGGAAVALAYEAQGNERRDQLVANFEQRADLAKKRLALATEELKGTEQRVSVGVASNTDLLENWVRVAEAQAQVRIITLQLEEVRLAGREPRIELSSPLVSGRDFVGERLRVEMSVPERMVALESARLKDAQRRFEVGVSTASELEVSQHRVLEVQTALETWQKKIQIRQKFLSGGFDAVETELRVLKAEAEQLKKTLAPKLQMAGKESARIAARVEVGTAERVELAQAKLRQLELETSLSKADLDLVLIRRRIDQHRTGK